MNRKPLYDVLDLFQATWTNTTLSSGRMRERDREMQQKFRQFIVEHPLCFERSNLPGHVTGSALVINKSLTKVLLTHHRKLDIWLQLGGHADGNPDVSEVALTEALEESGLKNLQFYSYESLLFGKQYAESKIPFDLDSHLIPKNPKDHEHWHFDVRYLIATDDKETPVVSHESNDVRWFTLHEARLKTQEDSMERQFQKVELIRRMIS